MKLPLIILLVLGSLLGSSVGLAQRGETRENSAAVHQNISQPFKHIHDRYPNCRRDVEDFWQQTDAMKRVMEQYAKSVWPESKKILDHVNRMAKMRNQLQQDIYDCVKDEATRDVKDPYNSRSKTHEEGSASPFTAPGGVPGLPQPGNGDTTTDAGSSPYQNSPRLSHTPSSGGIESIPPRHQYDSPSESSIPDEDAPNGHTGPDPLILPPEAPHDNFGGKSEGLTNPEQPAYQ